MFRSRNRKANFGLFPHHFSRQMFLAAIAGRPRPFWRSLSLSHYILHLTTAKRRENQTEMGNEYGSTVLVSPAKYNQQKDSWNLVGFQSFDRYVRWLGSILLKVFLRVRRGWKSSKTLGGCHIGRLHSRRRQIVQIFWQPNGRESKKSIGYETE